MNRPTVVLLASLVAANLSINFCEASQTRLNEHEQNPHNDLQQHPHRVYLGPEIFRNRLSDSVHSAAYHKKVIFNTTYYGFRGGWEHYAPKTYYLNLEGACAWGSGHTKYSYESRYFNATVRNKFHSPSLFANAEFQGGYSFQPYQRYYRQVLLTPFLSVGTYHASASGRCHMHLTWVYLSAGMRTVYSFSRLFDLGFYFKGMRAVYVNHGSMKDFWGYEFDLPLTWHFGGHRRWDIEFLPFYSKLNTHENDYIFGGRLLLGYRF